MNINGAINGLHNGFANVKSRGNGKNAETPAAEAKDGKKNAAPEAEKESSANGALKEQLAGLQEKVAARTAAAGEKPSAEPQSRTAGEGVTAAAAPEDQAAHLSFMDKLKELQDGFTSQLLEALGLGSLKDGGKGADFSAVGISAQYSLNIATTMSVMNADGSMTQSTFNFSLEGSFDYLGIAAGKGSGANSLASLFGGKGADDAEGAAGTGSSFLDKLKEMFSPEATAQRILDFSLSFYGRSSMFKEAGGDTDDARANFADYIGAAIQKGFDQALGILGKSINDQTSGEIDRTHELVFNGLDDFVNRREKSDDGAGQLDGYSRSKDGLYGNLQYFASSLSVNYSSTTAYYSADEVRQLRGNAGNPYANAVQTQDNPSSVGAARSDVDGDNLNMTV